MVKFDATLAEFIWLPQVPSVLYTSSSTHILAQRYQGLRVMCEPAPHERKDPDQEETPEDRKFIKTVRNYTDLLASTGAATRFQQHSYAKETPNRLALVHGVITDSDYHCSTQKPNSRKTKEGRAFELEVSFKAPSSLDGKLETMIVEPSLTPHEMDKVIKRTGHHYQSQLPGSSVAMVMAPNPSEFMMGNEEMTKYQPVFISSSQQWNKKIARVPLPE